MMRLTICPVCRHTEFSEFLTCKDYTVSHETFHLARCNECGFVFTNPRPDDHELGAYYQSEKYISHSDRSKNAVDSIYRIARTFTLRWKYQLLQRHTVVKPESILDVGCGTGAFLQHCKKNNMAIAGVEPATSARNAATETTGTTIHAELAEVSGNYDTITLWHVLEHVSDLNGTIKKLKDSLSKNGTMFIAVPNLNSADAKKYQEHWAAYDVPRHLWHFSRNTMSRIVNSHQMKIADILPMRLDAYYVSLLSERYKTGKHNVGTMVKAVVGGYNSNLAAKKSTEYSSLIYIVRS